jgi:hypothetical protein
LTLERVRRIREETAERLSRRDRLTRAAIRRRAERGEHPTTVFHFTPGQLVLRRVKRLGKIAPKADGPYRVVAVKGLLGQRVMISPEAPMSKRKRDLLEVHASTLAPYHGRYAEPEVVGAEEQLEEAGPSSPQF